MKNIPVLLFLLLVSCQSPQQVYKPTNFKLIRFEQPYPDYNFSKIIDDPVLKNRGPQTAARQFSLIGNHKKALESWSIQFNREIAPLPTPKADTFKQFRSADAIPYILKKAANHRVTIINEAHHIAQHRVFTTLLLEGLYKEGYRHFGLEAFPTSPQANKYLIANGYPEIRSSGYFAEPQFAHLIRTAHQIGFKLFGYEGNGGGSQREIDQAKNIQKYMENNPEGKVLIHCGYDHGYEGNLSNKWKKAMAGRLTEFTGIDPFTINQTAFSEKSQRKFEQPYYQLTDVNQPTIYFESESKVFNVYQDEAYFDVAVFHPRSGIQDRPDWLIYGNRKRIKLNLEEAGISFPCLVFAYVKGENINEAIPYDIQETKDRQVTLVLAPGQYNIVLLNEKEKAAMVTIKVN